MVSITLSDDESGSGVRRDSSFVKTPYGDGLLELRSRQERRVAPPGIQKVRLTWATAFVKEG